MFSIRKSVRHMSVSCMHVRVAHANFCVQMLHGCLQRACPTSVCIRNSDHAQHVRMRHVCAGLACVHSMCALRTRSPDGLDVRHGLALTIVGGACQSWEGLVSCGSGLSVVRPILVCDRQPGSADDPGLRLVDLVLCNDVIWQQKMWDWLVFGNSQRNSHNSSALPACCMCVCVPRMSGVRVGVDVDGAGAGVNVGVNVGVGVGVGVSPRHVRTRAAMP
eukprot:318459-Chlamydomonas_euryale.AAC.2